MIREFPFVNSPTSLRSTCGRPDLKRRAGMMRRFASPSCKMLAEKLEPPHEFQQARDMGFV